MHNVLLAVRVAQKGSLPCYLSFNLSLPFIPYPGMRFEQGSSCTMWETSDGELDPAVERVIYDIDEEWFVCLFTVSTPLSASLWKADPALESGSVSAVEQYFRHLPI